MALKFSLLKPGKISNVNVRKEGASKEILAVDVKVNGLAPGEVLVPLLGCNKSDITIFWDQETDEVRPRFNGFGKVEVWSEFDDCTSMVADYELTGSQIKKISFTFQPGKAIDLTFNITISDVSDDDVKYLTHVLKDEVMISVDDNGLNLQSE